MSLPEFAPASTDRIRETTTLVEVPGGRGFRLEIFEPSDAKLHPGVIVLHGADGPTRRAEEYREVCRALVAAGFVALRPHYFEAGNPAAPAEETLANPLEHAAWIQAVRLTAEHSRRLPAVMDSPLALVGFSLGGYVAMAAAALNPGYAAVVELFGGFPPTIVPAVQTMPPTLVLHGDNDDRVPLREAHRIQELYRAKNLPLDIHIYQGEGHHFTPAARADAIRRTREFLLRHLQPPL